MCAPEETQNIRVNGESNCQWKMMSSVATEWGLVR